MTLNLQTDEGKEIFRKLVLEADVVIEGFRPGVMARFGLDYETVSSLHPGIIYCSDFRIWSRRTLCPGRRGMI